MKNLFLNFLGDFKRNYKTLILAFFISFALWVVVSIQVFPTMEKEIKGVVVEMQLTDYMARNNLQIVNDINDSVNIKIQGKRYNISRLGAQEFFATVDLDSVRSAGKVTLPLEVIQKTDSECKILETDPKLITLEIDEIITKEFPIKGTAPDISLPEGFYVDVDDITTSPATISITGSASMLDKIKTVEAKSTFHGNITESSETNSDIIIYGENGTKMVTDKLKFSTEIVTVNIPIYKQKELPVTLTINYPVNFDKDSLKYTINPETIIIAAPDNTIDNQSQIDIGTINLSDVKPSVRNNFTITLPKGYKNISGNHYAFVTWETDNYGIFDYTVSSENITVTNAPDNFDVSLVTNQLSVTVAGPSEIIANLAEGDFTATVNLMGVNLREGTQDATAAVQIKGAGLKCWVMGDYKVKINAVSKNGEGG